MKRGTLALSWGPYGGFYMGTHRVCLGWVAITWVRVELDDLIEGYADYWEGAAALKKEIGRLREPGMNAAVARENRWRAGRLERLLKKELPLDREGIDVHA